MYSRITEGFSLLTQPCRHENRMTIGTLRKSTGFETWIDYQNLQAVIERTRQDQDGVIVNSVKVKDGSHSAELFYDA
jgi:hypothetical protein